MNDVSLQMMHAALSVSRRAANRLAEIHKSWTLLSPQPEFLLNKHASFLQSHVAKLRKQNTTVDASRYVLPVGFVVSVYSHLV